MDLLFTISITIILNFAFVFYLEKIASILNIYDYPDNIRKKHKTPTNYYALKHKKAVILSIENTQPTASFYYYQIS